MGPDPKNPMLQFVSRDGAMPEKRTSEDRREDFFEIYQDYAAKAAGNQAGRCSQCGVPFCQIGCPLENNIPDWLLLTASGRLEEAYKESAATNILPEICGRICPQDRLCEGLCVLEQSGHGTVTIGAIEKYITDTAWENDWVKPIVPAHEYSHSVGIIGAGPAGFAAAAVLRSQGTQVTIYDRYDRAGGLMIYGIPGFKLEKDIVLRRQAWLQESGVTFKLGTEIGKHISFEELRTRHDALLIATGVYKARTLDAPGHDLPGIVPAMPYLTASNRKGLGDQVPEFDQGLLNAKNRRVVVIGGGDTAMDCVRTAVRQGAVSVTCLYRRDRANMPGSAREVANAEEEGIVFRWLTQPIGFKGKTHIDHVTVQSMKLGDPDASGRRLPVAVEGEVEDLPADLVIQALGFEPEDLPHLWGQSDLPVSRFGTIMAHPDTGATSMEGVYAAGDIVRGASLVVWAVRDGMAAANAILQQRSQEKAAA